MGRPVQAPVRYGRMNVPSFWHVSFHSISGHLSLDLLLTFSSLRLCKLNQL